MLSRFLHLPLTIRLLLIYCSIVVLTWLSRLTPLDRCSGNDYPACFPISGLIIILAAEPGFAIWDKINSYLYVVGGMRYLSLDFLPHLLIGYTINILILVLIGEILNPLHRFKNRLN